MEFKQRYFIHVAYSGKNYNGWQVQKNGISIQETLNHALSTLLQNKINVLGCGRTDTGVHAESYYAHFDLTDLNIVHNKNSLIKKLNGFLPSDIVIFDLIPVQKESNARFSAISRTYEYRISRVKNPFNNDFTYGYYGNLDIHILNEASKILYDYSDFTSFSKLHTKTQTNFCKISEAGWMQTLDVLTFRITADRFLRNMVRAIVGTIMDAGRGKMTLQDLRNIIESKNRSAAGTSVPAQGLFLVDVRYPDDIFLS
jgi:tRNA pseudouridine38-40 synthase